jgi:hypothetical protein
MTEGSNLFRAFSRVCLLMQGTHKKYRSFGG